MDLELLNAIDSFVWGPPLLVLLVGTGIILSARLRFLQIGKLPRALGLIFKAKSLGAGDTSSFKALCTALAATMVPVILSVWQRPSKRAAPGRCSGCGSPLSSVWLPNMRKVCWP